MQGIAPPERLGCRAGLSSLFSSSRSFFSSRFRFRLDGCRYHSRRLLSPLRPRRHRHVIVVALLVPPRL